MRRSPANKPVHLDVANPTLPIGLSQSLWQQINGVEKEMKLVADLLDSKPLTGSYATKPAVLKSLSTAKSMYLATNTSWSQSSFVLAMADNILEINTQETDTLGM